jgi:hypothetical protein
MSSYPIAPSFNILVPVTYSVRDHQASIERLDELFITTLNDSAMQADEPVRWDSFLAKIDQRIKGHHMSIDTILGDSMY